MAQTTKRKLTFILWAVLVFGLLVVAKLRLIIIDGFPASPLVSNPNPDLSRTSSVPFQPDVKASFKRRLVGARTYLEFGSRAQLSLSSVRRVISILPSSNRCVETRRVRCVRCCGRLYVHQFERLHQRTWDFVRIDGAARTAVALAAVPFLRNNSVVALHGGKPLDDKLSVFYLVTQSVDRRGSSGVLFLKRRSDFSHMEGNVRAVKLLINDVENIERTQRRLPVKQRRRITSLSDNFGLGQCFKPSAVNTNVRCAACVNFLTIAMADSPRWRSFGQFIPALRVISTTLVRSQKCFKLFVYTNAQPNSPGAKQLADAGGPSIVLKPFPTDLPDNAYTNKNRWIALSRARLDVVERHMQEHKHKVIWTDMDTLVTTDLSCAYARASNFVVSRWQIGYPPVVGPRNESVYSHPQRLVLGDLWMADSALIEQLHELERSGMPAPKYDLQDYFTFVLNKCDGSLTDLRSIVREKGLGIGDGMCFGFDWLGGHFPHTKKGQLTVLDKKLYCRIVRRGDVQFHPVASMSFTSPVFRHVLRKPQLVFKTSALQTWAKQRGFSFRAR